MIFTEFLMMKNKKLNFIYLIFFAFVKFLSGRLHFFDARGEKFSFK